MLKSSLFFRPLADIGFQRNIKKVNFMSLVTLETVDVLKSVQDLSHKDIEWYIFLASF